MRPGRRLATLAVAAVLAGSACTAPVAIGPGRSPSQSPPPTDESPVTAVPAGREGPAPGTVALCTVLPSGIVGDLIGTRAALDASGSGSQCTWRSSDPAATGGGTTDPVDDGATLQGALLDAAAYHAGRPGPDDPSVVSVDELSGVGDEAFVVRLAEGSPTTLYVRDGQRALSLWLDDVQLSPESTERSLARMASLLLNLA